ncbi:unnamed protein product [Mytilus coruscus]|uniref:Uncharacterized protein n=1 Tax=Mytilus coruscus TaxID=42192 RepID=A0A6J8AUV8_MYTCO|nr:unnamed protein product [Mytilus coruscus]
MSQTLEGIVDKDDPELDAFSDICWIVEQKKDEDIARALELKRAGHKPTKREIGKQPLGTRKLLYDCDKLVIKKEVLYRVSKFNDETIYQLILPAIYRNIAVRDINIPVYVIKPEYGKSKLKTKTVHRNLLLPIYSLPTEELVPQSKKERNSKCTSETNRVDDEIQIVESVKDTECTGSIHEYSDESDIDPDYALMPFVQPGNISSTSGTPTGLFSRHIDETLNTSSRLTQEQSSLIAQNSDISNEVSSVPESTHVPVEQFNEPVLRRTSRQSRKPDRYGMYSSSYIFASSRGSSMSQVDCKQVNIITGGTYDRLCSLAEKRLHNIVHPKIVYFVAGIPDICSLVRIKNEKYEESYLYLEKDHVALIQEAMSDVGNV